MRALLKWLRRHDLTPAQFADCLGVSRATVHRWVNDGAIPTPDSPVDARKRSQLPEQV